MFRVISLHASEWRRRCRVFIFKPGIKAQSLKSFLTAGYWSDGQFYPCIRGNGRAPLILCDQTRWPTYSTSSYLHGSSSLWELWGRPQFTCCWNRPVKGRTYSNYSWVTTRGGLTLQPITGTRPVSWLEGTSDWLQIILVGENKFVHWFLSGLSQKTP